MYEGAYLAIKKDNVMTSYKTKKVLPFAMNVFDGLRVAHKIA